MPHDESAAAALEGLLRRRGYPLRPRPHRQLEEPAVGPGVEGEAADAGWGVVDEAGDHEARGGHAVVRDTAVPVCTGLVAEGYAGGLRALG
eukprot:COSAG04_NODE_281_length_18193_cov_4.163701_4_plen_91_part_00